MPNLELVPVLQQTITLEVAKALGFSRTGRAPKLIAPLVAAATGRFARLAARFDEDVVSAGLCEAARRFLPAFIAGCRQTGAEGVPVAGPLLIASNHPGASDALAIAVSLGRDDLHIALSDSAFVRALPHAGQHFIRVPLDTEGRAQVIREIIETLRAGKSVLIFPTGHVTPDPEMARDPAIIFEDWSESIALILKRVPEAQVVTAIASGVLHPKYLRHPLLRLRRLAWRRQILAEFLQVLHQMVQQDTLNLEPRVSFGPPAAAATLSAKGDRGSLHTAVLGLARETLELHLEAGNLAHRVAIGAAHVGT